MAVEENTRLEPGGDVLTRRVKDETVLLQTGSEFYFGLDAVGTAMWEAILRKGTIAAAHADLVPEYEVAPERLLADMHDLVERLVEKGLLTVVTD